MSGFAWKWMEPAEVCDVMDFWASVTYPVNRAEVIRLARERFGWATRLGRGKEHLVNSGSGLSIPDVSTVAPGDVFASLSFWVTDVIREVSEESSAFLGDRFALLVREGSSRWGKPKLVESDGHRRAKWVGPERAEFLFILDPMSVTATFTTPQQGDYNSRSALRGI